MRLNSRAIQKLTDCLLSVHGNSLDLHTPFLMLIPPLNASFKYQHILRIVKHELFGLFKTGRVVNNVDSNGIGQIN